MPQIRPPLANAAAAPRATWLARLPAVRRDVERRWSLTLGTPFAGHERAGSWVAPAVRADGSTAVLKIAMPHMEGEHEIAGLRFWDGDPTVRLIEADESLGAMLLERCEPGTALRSTPEPEQDRVVAGLLRRLWRAPAPPHPFRSLTSMIDAWSAETLQAVDRWPDEGLVREGLRVFGELTRSMREEVLLATDLHAGNVLRARRVPWLVVDPKPFVGEQAYDATQHLLNCADRVREDAGGTIGRFADLLGVDAERVRLWTFARAAAGPRDDWRDESWMALARAVDVRGTA